MLPRAGVRSGRALAVSLAASDALRASAWLPCRAPLSSATNSVLLRPTLGSGRAICP